MERKVWPSSGCRALARRVTLAKTVPSVLSPSAVRFLDKCIPVSRAVLSLRGCVWASSRDGEQGSSGTVMRGFSLRWLGHVAKRPLWGAWVSVVMAPRLEGAGSVVGTRRLSLVASTRGGSSWSRDGTRVPCVGPLTLNHQAPGKAFSGEFRPAAPATGSFPRLSVSPPARPRGSSPVGSGWEDPFSSRWKYLFCSPMSLSS